MTPISITVSLREKQIKRFVNSTMWGVSGVGNSSTSFDKASLTSHFKTNTMHCDKKNLHCFHFKTLHSALWSCSLFIACKGEQSISVPQCFSGWLWQQWVFMRCWHLLNLQCLERIPLDQQMTCWTHRYENIWCHNQLQKFPMLIWLRTVLFFYLHILNVICMM